MIPMAAPEARRFAVVPQLGEQPSSFRGFLGSWRCLVRSDLVGALLLVNAWVVMYYSGTLVVVGRKSPCADAFLGFVRGAVIGIFAGLLKAAAWHEVVGRRAVLTLPRFLLWC